MSDFDPEDPAFKEIRHRYYQLGDQRRKKILQDLVDSQYCGGARVIVMNNKVPRSVEKNYLIEIAKDGRLAELIQAIEKAEAEKKDENNRALQPQS